MTFSLTVEKMLSRMRLRRLQGFFTLRRAVLVLPIFNLWLELHPTFALLQTTHRQVTHKCTNAIRANGTPPPATL